LAIALTAYSAYVIGQEAIDYYYDKKKDEEWDRRIDALAHKRKKQSTGKKPDWHDKQYTHGGKKQNKNPNQRKDAEKRRNSGREEN
jgi:hypothetical protein